MSKNLELILATNGSVKQIRELNLTNEELLDVAEELFQAPTGHAEFERDPVIGDVVPVRVRVTRERSLASAVILAQR